LEYIGILRKIRATTLKILVELPIFLEKGINIYQTHLERNQLVAREHNPKSNEDAEKKKT